MRRRRRPTVRPSPANPLHPTLASLPARLPPFLSPPTCLAAMLLSRNFGFLLSPALLAKSGKVIALCLCLVPLSPTPRPLGAHVCTLKCAVFGCCNTKFHKNLSVYNMNVWGMLRLRLRQRLRLQQQQRSQQQQQRRLQSNIGHGPSPM